MGNSSPLLRSNGSNRPTKPKLPFRSVLVVFAIQDSSRGEIMRVPFVDLQAQQAQVEDQLNEVIRHVIKQAHFVLGPEVGEFESEFASYCGTQYAVGVDSGLSALELALRAFEIGPGAEV